MAKTVLIVEDERMLAEALSHTLRSSGYETRMARNGKECLDLLEEGLPDLILMDVMMPEMNGVELLEEMEKHEQYAAIPVIVLTNADDMDTISGIVSHGGYDYFIKAQTPLEKIVELVGSKIGQ